MSILLYETALKEKGIKKSDLPAETQSKISKMTALCRQLSEEDDDDTIEALNDKIDDLDDEISREVESFTPASNNPPAENGEESGSNAIVVVSILGLLGAIGWAVSKALSGGNK
jgi:hypothetical protein